MYWLTDWQTLQIASSPPQRGIAILWQIQRASDDSSWWRWWVLGLILAPLKHLVTRAALVGVLYRPTSRPGPLYIYIYIHTYIFIEIVYMNGKQIRSLALSLKHLCPQSMQRYVHLRTVRTNYLKRNIERVIYECDSLDGRLWSASDPNVFRYARWVTVSDSPLQLHDYDFVTPISQRVNIEDFRKTFAWVTCKFFSLFPVFYLKSVDSNEGCSGRLYGESLHLFAVSS